MRARPGECLRAYGSEGLTQQSPSRMLFLPTVGYHAPAVRLTCLVEETQEAARQKRLYTRLNKKASEIDALRSALAYNPGDA